MSQYQVILQPIGRHIQVKERTTVLDAAREAGVDLVSICGGDGTCGTCLVRIVKGKVTPVNITEEGEISADDIRAGFRLACQVEVLGDIKVEIPPESFTTPQRLQVEGVEVPLELDPVYKPVDLDLPPASLDDLRSDSTRLLDSLRKNYGDVALSRQVVSEYSGLMRQEKYKLRIAMNGNKVVSILSQRQSLFGLAVDIGTTKLAAYLVDLETGETVGKAGAMNPQIAFGEDVISRISYATQNKNGAKTLQSRLVETLNSLLEELTRNASISINQVVAGVMVGNTAMHHLFTGLPVKQLGESPYVAALGEAIEFGAEEIGLHLAVGGQVYMPPNIAGYVGADHIAMLLGAGLSQVSQTTVALDIGTNTEISLLHAGQHYACSCASGPAFEGAHIQNGMRAAEGAIERVLIDGEEIKIQTIGKVPAVGICGSGILDVVSELVKNKIIDRRGVFAAGNPKVVSNTGMVEFILVSADQSGIGKDIRVSRRDINEIQLAKGAIRAGVEVLMLQAGIQADEISDFIVAGAFGSYLDVESAVRIGMFPNLPKNRFRQIGNAAGSGARKLLLSRHQRDLADELAGRIQYVELATHPNFMKIYTDALAFSS